ncbi:phage baseplate assembly protein [Falsiroseomonas sp.]|uniref:phage baseplate assembly protein domain-containing protein n=1 Tax=Falsiroseomonas sp. TaxID=2870721 RepID=UPI002726BF96|nr:phage baseplate assembly protein [Falsiroseomonas sp.]MDO9501383.1 phage baseplate assembly protein [Falsiroseomonas sp.]
MDELLAQLRGLVQRGVVHRVDDLGATQTADVETAEGVVRGAAQVLQMPGLACNPGTAGVMAVVLACGGDQGIPLVWITATGAGLGGLPAGEAVLYALDNSARVHVRPGGLVHVVAATRVTVEAPEIEATATTRATVTAPTIEATATTKATVTAPAIDLVGAVNVLGSLKVNGVTLNVP